MNCPLRVALFTDTFDEPNGVATLSRQFAQFAEARSLPFLVVRGSNETRFECDGPFATQLLRRSLLSFPLDKDLYFDPLLTRYKQLVLDRLNEFKPDLIHITGPGDIGFLGLLVSHIAHIPLVASWHTNLHEYLAKRLDLNLHLLPDKLRRQAATFVEKQSLRGLLRFYKTARFTFAPNQSLVDLMQSHNHRPSFLMDHGVDLARFYGREKPRRTGEPFCIGYVGRLTTEKNIRYFAELERQLIAAGEHDFRFLIVGDGGQTRWLHKHLSRVELPGILRGEELVAAYQQMHAFVFPSRTDTFGLVTLEAMASGVPVILAPETGHRVGIEDGAGGFLCTDFAAAVRRLMHDDELRLSMSRMARNFANTKSWSHVFDNVYETYRAGLALSDMQRAEREALV